MYVVHTWLHFFRSDRNEPLIPAVAEGALVESELRRLAVVFCSANIEAGIVLDAVELVFSIHFRHARSFHFAYRILHCIVFVLRQSVACNHMKYTSGSSMWVTSLVIYLHEKINLASVGESL